MTEHVPVLPEEVMEGLEPEAGDKILDATLGGGGHTEKILERITPGGRLIAVDADPHAIEMARGRLGRFGESVIFVNDNFGGIDGILDDIGIARIDGALFDLGMSSLQVDDASRGFSFRKDGPLDMRFDQAKGVPAAKIVNSLSRLELEKIIREYGEERHAKLVAGKICEARKRKPIDTTLGLAEIVVEAVGKRYGKEHIHPAARTFQALRIRTNLELVQLERGLGGALRRLAEGARICVISFHSLEDRIVKNIFRDGVRSGDLKLITKKPVEATRSEIERNARSRSAKLRIAERIREWTFTGA